MKPDFDYDRVPSLGVRLERGHAERTRALAGFLRAVRLSPWRAWRFLTGLTRRPQVPTISSETFIPPA